MPKRSGLSGSGQVQRAGSTFSEDQDPRKAPSPANNHHKFSYAGKNANSLQKTARLSLPDFQIGAAVLTLLPNQFLCP